MDLDEVRSRLKDALSKHGTELSPIAVEIVSLSITAMTEDPHPGWRIGLPFASPASIQNDMIHSAAVKLLALRRRVLVSRDQYVLNTFDVLHSISGWVDELCPFEKPNGRR